MSAFNMSRLIRLTTFDYLPDAACHFRQGDTFSMSFDICFESLMTAVLILAVIVVRRHFPTIQSRDGNNFHLDIIKDFLISPLIFFGDM